MNIEISFQLILITFLISVNANQLIDLCLTSKNTCSQICTDANNGINVVCSCYQGYKLASDEVTCLDIDECSFNPCPNRQECENLAGGYECHESENERHLSRPHSRYGQSEVAPPYVDDNWMIAVTKMDPVGDSDHHSRNKPSLTNAIFGIESTETDASLRVQPRKSAEASSGLPYSMVKSGTRCPTGYKEDTKHSMVCVDIDECIEGSTDCTEEPYTVCQNLYGKFTCVPSATSYLLFRGEPRGVISSMNPENSGSYFNKNWLPTRDGALIGSDSCAPGLRKKSPHGKCLDIDECLIGSHSCDSETEICENIIGDYKCIPKDFHRRLIYDKSRDKSSDDSRNQNTPKNNADYSSGYSRTVSQVPSPSYHHSRTDGGHSRDSSFVGGHSQTSYRTSTSITDPKKALESQRNENKNPDGTCKLGFKLDTSTAICEDTDECLDGPCPIGLICTNLIGGFECNCERGFVLRDGACADIDECSLGNFCRQSERCINIPGTFKCEPKPLECNNGLVLNPRKNRCVDIDECAMAIHDCKPDQKCVNTFGSYECRCRYGYTLDANRTCVDVDECEIYTNDQTCNDVSTCSNTIGSYECLCNPGYKINDKDECEDVDECAESKDGNFQYMRIESNGTENNVTESMRKDEEEIGTVENGTSSVRRSDGKLCEHACKNTIGSYTCSCLPGYKIDPNDTTSCIDVDECAHDQMINEDPDKSFNKGIKYCQGFCTNLDGSYACSCPPGYTLNDDGKTCDDVNECDMRSESDEKMDMSSSNETLSDEGPCKNDEDICLNIRGGFKCYKIECPDGYDRDTAHAK